MIEKPPMVWRPAHRDNYYPGRFGALYEALVAHASDGDGSPAPWFQDPHAGASTPYGILPDGTIEQYVSLDNTAMAHGIVEVEYADARKLIRDNWGLSPNLWAIGVEVVGTTAQIKAGLRPTVEQRRSFAWLGAWLFAEVILPNAARTGAVVDRDHFLMHREISPGSRTCPVWAEPVQLGVLADIEAILESGETVVIPVFPPRPLVSVGHVTLATIDVMVQWSREVGLPPDLTPAVGWGESKLNENDETGDGGISVGVIQIKTTVHGGPNSRWTGVQGVLPSLRQMQDRWLTSFHRYGGASEWIANPERFLYLFWKAAQGTKNYASPERISEAVAAGRAALARWERESPQPVDWRTIAEQQAAQLRTANAEIDRLVGREVALRDAGTLQADELERAGAAQIIQAQNWRRVIAGQPRVGEMEQ